MLRPSLILAFLLLLPSITEAGGDTPVFVPTASVFEQFSPGVVKVEVIEKGSAAKATIGSGFFVSDDGYLITNYHVVSKVVHDPERYYPELVDASGESHPVDILAVDVIHDLAVLKSSLVPSAFLSLLGSPIKQGDRLYALGHPHDLGLSIVEGTYNRDLEHTLYPKIHFTGSLNPGMSGGPTISHTGNVVGVNVSTAGNQVSFLVPVNRVVDILAQATAPGYQPPAALLPTVASQMRAFQNVYVTDILSAEAKTVPLGRYTVPTEPAPFFRCWGDVNRSPERLHESVSHRCSTDDYVFIAGKQYSGIVTLNYQLITSDALSPLRFYALYASIFEWDTTPGGWEEHVTSWRCETQNVRNDSLPLRSVLCLRRYRKLDGLYDAVLKTAALGDHAAGLMSTLTMSGLEFENIRKLVVHHLEGVAWN